MKLMDSRKYLIVIFLSFINMSVIAEKSVALEVLEQQCAEKVNKEPTDQDDVSRICGKVAQQYEQEKKYDSASWYFLLAGKFGHNIKNIKPYVTEYFAFSNIAFSHALLHDDELKIKSSLERYLKAAPVEVSEEALRKDYKTLIRIFPEKENDLEKVLTVWNELSSALLPIKVLVKKYEKILANKNPSEKIEILMEISDLEASILDKNNPSFRSTRLALGAAYNNNKQYDRSLRLLEQLEGEYKVLPQEQAEYVQLLHLIAINQQRLKHFDKAKLYFNKAVIAAEGIFSKDHSGLISIYRDFANFLELAKDQANALIYYEKLLSVYKYQGFAQKLSIIPLQDKLAELYSAIKNYPKAVELLKGSLQIREEILEPESLEVADSVDLLGLVHNRIGEYKKALKLFNKALEIRIKKQKGNSSGLALSYKNIANSYSLLSESKLAIENYKKALKINQNALGLNHLETVLVTNKLAAELNQSGSRKASLDLYLNNLDASQKILGFNSKKLALIYSDIGNLHSALGNYPEALKFFEKALAIRERVFGRDHDDTATSYNNIGHVQQKLGHYGSAREYYSKALRVYDKVLGPEHPNTATSFAKIASLYLKLSDYPQALSYYSKALNIRKKVLGELNLDTAVSYIDLGDFYSTTRAYTKALKNYKQALTIREKLLGLDSPFTAEVNNKVGLAYASLGDEKEAIKFYQAALKVNIKTLGEESREAARNYNNIGLAYQTLNQIPEALDNLKQSLQILVKIKGEEQPQVANINHTIADLKTAEKEYEKALEYHKKALEIRTRISGQDQSQLISSYQAIADVYHRDEKFNESLKFNKKVLQAQQKTLTSDQIEISDTHQNIAIAYREIENNEMYYKSIKESFDVLIRNKNQIFPVLSQSQKNDYLAHNETKLALLFDATNKLLNSSKKPSKNDTVLKEIASKWLSYKGTVADEEDAITLLLKTTKNKQVKSKIGQLQSSRKSLLKLYRTRPKYKDLKGWSNNIAKFKRRIGILNDAIAKNEVKYKQSLDLVDIFAENIASQLDDNVLYVDYYRVGGNYYLLSVDNKNEIKFIKIATESGDDLDEVVQVIKKKIKTIDWAEKVTKKLLKKINKSSKKTLGKLYKILLSEPLGNVFEDNKGFIFALDGALKAFPFEALYDKENKKFLVNEKAIHYISNGREFIRSSMDTKVVEEEPESDSSQ